MLKIYIAAFVLNINLIFTAVNAASFNCSQPPNFANVDINACCRTPQLDLGTTPETCDKYINNLKTNNNMNNNNNDDEYPAYVHVCYPECIYRETGSLVDGEIKMENVKTFLQNHVNRRDKDIIPHILQSFEACLTNIHGHMQSVGIKMYAKLADGCSPYASMLYACVNAETFLNCPAKMWKNDRSCNLAKQFAAQCNPLPHVPLPMV